MVVHFIKHILPDLSYYMVQMIRHSTPINYIQ
jgi:hypothetical protein